MRPADQSHGRGWGQPPPTRSQPPHSLPVCAHVSLTLSAPRTHRKTSSPSPSLPWKRVHPAGLRRERPEVPVWGEKGGGGRNSTCWGPPRNSVKLLHSHSAPSEPRCGKGPHLPFRCLPPVATQNRLPETPEAERHTARRSRRTPLHSTPPQPQRPAKHPRRCKIRGWVCSNPRMRGSTRSVVPPTYLFYRQVTH